MARWKAILLKVPKSQVFRVQRKKRAPFALRYLPHAAFATALLGVLFGSFRNQFGELFATYQPLARKPSLMITGGTAPPVNPPAGLRVVGPADDLSDGSPKVIGLGGNSAGTPLGPKVIELNASSAGAPAGPASRSAPMRPQRGTARSCRRS
jgi:hypothetical protein